MQCYKGRSVFFPSNLTIQIVSSGLKGIPREGPWEHEKKLREGSLPQKSPPTPRLCPMQDMLEVPGVKAT